MIPTPKAYPGKQRRRRYIPDRPPGGYHVREEPEDVTLFPAGMDHVAELRAALTRLEQTDELMLTLERRIGTLADRLNDPALMVDYPPTHPTRIEAEDRLTALLKRYSEAEGVAMFWAGTVHSHGAQLVREGREDELTAIGQTLVTGDGALGRVQASVSGLITGATWQRLVAAACPF
jgi:hypothetical protein